MNLSQSTGLPPAAELLKYVAFKNHGLLLLSDLNEEKSTIDDEEFDERVDIIIDEFSEALLYDSDEDLFLELLYSISMSLGYNRIARLCLECVIESPSRTHSLYDEFESGKFLTPSDYRVLKSYFMLCNKLNDSSTLNDRRVTADMALQMEFTDKRFEQEDDVSWLSKTSESELKPRSFVYSGSISISSADWLSLLGSIQEFVINLAAKTKRKLTIEDPYNNSLQPSNAVTLTLPMSKTITQESSSSTPMEVDPIEGESTPTTKAADESLIVTSDKSSAEAAPKKKRRKSFDEAMRSRSSKRVKARTDDKQYLEDVDLTEDESFFIQISSFLSLCDETFDSVVSVFLNEDYQSSDQYIADFKSVIQNWDEEQAEIFAKMKSDNTNKSASKKPLLSQLIDSSGSNDKPDVERPTSLASTQSAKDFIELTNNHKFHVQELRVELIRSILRPRNQDLSPLFSEVWPLSAVDMLKKIVDQCEPQLGDVSRQILTSESSDEIFNEIYIAQTIMELISDNYLQAMKVLRAPDHHTKQTLKDMELIRSTSPARYMWWRRMFNDLMTLYSGNFSNLNSLILRHEWSNVLVQQVECDESWENLEDFLAVEDDILTIDKNISFNYVNFPSLPELSLSCIRGQISRLKAMATLSQVFAENQDDKQSNDDKSSAINARISLLECVLMPEYQQTLLPEYGTISDYFVHAPLKLRTKFWAILLADYSNIGEKQKSLDGYLKLLSDNVEEFTNDNYESSSDQQKSLILIRSVYMCHDVISKIMPLLQLDDFLLGNVSEEKLKSYMSAIIKLLRMLHLFILFEDAIINNALTAPPHASWEKVSLMIKELIVYGWCLLYFIFRATVPKESQTPEILNDVLSIIHEQLGTRGYCGIGNGILLDISLKELNRLKFSESDADLLQCLHCRYGIVLGHDDFHPYDHHTTPEDIDKDTAMMLVGFVMKIILRKKNIAQSILRSDVKGVLDQFYDAIGLPDQTVSAIEKSNSTLNNLLNSTISILFLQECFYGRYTLELATPSLSLYRLASSGFYYFLGQTRMSLFKVRKRSLPGRTEDISEAIKFLKCDLMCGCSTRFETWYALSQGYDALVEDDLTWNTYKINSASAREAVGIRQRKAIISCAIAVNCYLKNGSSNLFANTPTYQHLIGPAWSFFARLLFNSIQPPLEMEAYVSDKEKLLCRPDGLYSRPAKYQIKSSVILKAALLCLRLATKEMPNDWYNFYLKGKCLHQLKEKPEKVLNSFCHSISLCPEKPGSHGELVLEPHYKLVSRVYKYLREGLITREVAMTYLEKTQYFEEKVIVGPTAKPENDKIYGICITTLAKIRAGDKKKWHHRPTYRIAKIYDECGDVQKAKEEMITFFQIKSTSKTPIHIWKTEFERPGQHFQYVNQYVKYFITLLERTNDAVLFGILSKSLRKFVSGMINHQQVWEFLCTTVSRMLKDQLDIPMKYNDNVIPQLVFDEFDQNTLKISQYVETNEELHPLLKYLNYAAELRRLNNGFGSTAALDDIFVALYLRIYQDFVNNIFSAKESSGKASTPPPVIKPEVKIHTPAPTHPSTKISVMDLLSQPSTPASKPSTPVPSEIASKGHQSTPAGKVRVTRRDIISRSLALLRVALPKLVKGDNLKIPSPPPTGPNKQKTSADDSEATHPNGDPSNLNGTINGEASNSSIEIKQENGEKAGIPSTPISSKASLSAITPNDNGSAFKGIDISGEEAETVPSTPVAHPVSFAENDRAALDDDGDVVVIESSPVPGATPAVIAVDDSPSKPIQDSSSAPASRPRSRNSDWLSTIL